MLGFRDVERAARNLQNLVSGTSRRAKLLRLLTPALLRFLAGTPAPDAGLLNFLRLGEALGSRVDALGALRDNPPGLAFLSRVLGSGRLLGEVLVHVPEELQAIATPESLGGVKPREQLIREAVSSLEWRDPEQKLDGLRRFKRREMLRIALRDLAGEIDVESVGSALSDLADSALEAALGSPSLPFAIIGMGKLGGRELNYSSDVDVMFVHDGDPAAAEKEAERLLSSVGEVTPEGQAFRVDAGLRPEGKSGPLARSLESFFEYYERWSKPWEHQALIKARFAAGDAGLAERLLSVARARAFPEQLSAEALREMRHLKARMEKERVGRGDPRKHMKMGPGGIADVEFAVQLLQRLHGHSNDGLRVRSTMNALEAIKSADMMSESDARVLADAYSFLMRLRNRAFFLSGRPVDVLPIKPEDLEALGISMGFRDPAASRTGRGLSKDDAQGPACGRGDHLFLIRKLQDQEEEEDGGSGAKHHEKDSPTQASPAASGHQHDYSDKNQDGRDQKLAIVLQRGHRLRVARGGTCGVTSERLRQGEVAVAGTIWPPDVALGQTWAAAEVLPDPALHPREEVEAARSASSRRLSESPRRLSESRHCP